LLRDMKQRNDVAFTSIGVVNSVALRKHVSDFRSILCFDPIASRNYCVDLFLLCRIEDRDVCLSMCSVNLQAMLE